MAGWPNMRHLRLLEIAAREGSLTRAAQALNVSQPAASQAVAGLSRLFGAPLLERTGNSVVLTSAGEVVTKRTRRALAHLEDPAFSPGRRARPGSASVLERYASVTQLRVMSLFALTGSFAATARALGQTEASVQRATKDVARIIEQPVLEGRQQDRVLTAAGRNVAMRASLALREVELAHADLRERKGIFDSRLVIGALPLVRTQIVPTAAVRLLARYPSARLEILDGAYETLLHRLRLGACDMIIGALRREALDTDLSMTLLLRDKLSVVARAGHPLAGRRLSGPELACFPWVLPRKDAPARRVFEAFAARHGITAAQGGHVETGSLVVLRGVLLGSDALTLISPGQIGHEIVQGQITTLDIALEGGEREIGVTQLQGSVGGRLRSEFLRFLHETSQEYASEARAGRVQRTQNLSARATSNDTGAAGHL